MSYSVRVLRDSLSPEGVRLTTFEVTLPRIVLAELNTHRVFSRNSASSRAIPVEKRIAAVEDYPFVPEAFGRNQKGMQAESNLDDNESEYARTTWINARNLAVSQAKILNGLGVHKQLVNRLLEPFCWQTVLITATEWENFWGLRCNPDAQPEIRCAAEMMKVAYDESWPTQLQHDDWHLPLVDDVDQLRAEGLSMLDMVEICVGRCARVSYLTHDGKRDPRADIELCERLLKSGHLSPFEHAATPMTQEYADEVISKSLRMNVMLPYLADPAKTFCGPIRGWRSYRKMIPGEDNFNIRGTTSP